MAGAACVARKLFGRKKLQIGSAGSNVHQPGRYVGPVWTGVGPAALAFRHCREHDGNVQTEVQVRMNGTALSLGHDGKMIRYPGYGMLFAAWTVLGTLSYAHYRLLPGTPPENLLLGLFGWLACYYAWLPFTPIVFRLEQRFRIGWPFSPKNAAILILFALPFCYLAFLFAFVIAHTLHL